MKKFFTILICIGMISGLLMGGILMIKSLDSSKETEVLSDTQEEEIQYTTRERAYADANPKLSEDEVKLRVKLGLDKEPIKSAQEISDPASYTALVNAYHTLPSSYTPDDLVAIESPDPELPNGLREEAAKEFQALVDEAAQQGIDLQAAAAFISYENISELYQKLIEEYGPTVASQNILMNPGFSEYQTGLALDMDLNGKTYEEASKDPSYPWVKEHLAPHGFIVRYPEGKETITLLDAQPWHIRYVGKEAAKEMSEKNLSLEEYSILH